SRVVMILLEFVEPFPDLLRRKSFRHSVGPRSSSRSHVARGVAHRISDTGLIPELSIAVAPVGIVRFQNGSRSVFDCLLKGGIHIVYRDCNHHCIPSCRGTIIRSIQPHGWELFHETHWDTPDMHYRI